MRMTARGLCKGRIRLSPVCVRLQIDKQTKIQTQFCVLFDFSLSGIENPGLFVALWISAGRSAGLLMPLPFVTPDQMSEHARRRDLVRLRHSLSPCRGEGCARGAPTHNHKLLLLQIPQVGLPKGGANRAPINFQCAKCRRGEVQAGQKSCHSLI